MQKNNENPKEEKYVDPTELHNIANEMEKIMKKSLKVIIGNNDLKVILKNKQNNNQNERKQAKNIIFFNESDKSEQRRKN